MAVQIDQSRDALFDELGLMRLRESYMRADEKSPQERFKFVAETFGSNPEHAARIYEYASRHWLSFATPILAFGRTGRGLPVSCYLSYMDDSAEGLIETLSEVNRLSMLGGGVGIHVGIRSADEKSVGVMPHLKVYDASCLAYRQGSTRRGSYAAFLSIDHPDIIPFIEMRKPTGDQNLKALNLHHGVNITDAFMEKIEASMRDADADDSWDLRHPTTGEVVATVSARDLWQRLLEMRMHTGEPYLVFTDTANRALPSWLKDKGLSIHGSNLCTEIFLPTSKDRTAVCCLSSVNLEYYDEWRGNEQFIDDAMEFLDNVLQYFIEHAPTAIRRARYSAMRERSVGLGAHGLSRLSAEARHRLRVRRRQVHEPRHVQAHRRSGRKGRRAPVRRARPLSRRGRLRRHAPLLAPHGCRAQCLLVPHHGRHESLDRALSCQHLPSGYDLRRLHREEPLSQGRARKARP